jgi:hypothetical protein
MEFIILVTTFITCLKPGLFCDGTSHNAVPEVLSQKDVCRNGVPEPFSKEKYRCLKLTTSVHRAS